MDALSIKNYQTLMRSPLSSDYWAARLGVPVGYVEALRKGAPRDSNPNDEWKLRQVYSGRRQSSVSLTHENWCAAIAHARKYKFSWATKFYARAKREAERREIEFALTFDHLLGLLEQSNGKCMLTGVPFSEEKPQGSHAACFRPSLDRINSKIGYMEGNCRIVCLAANIALGEWGEEVFAVLAKSYVKKLQ